MEHDERTEAGKSEIGGEIANLDLALEALGRSLGAIISRLAPALKSPKPQDEPSGTKDRPILTDLANKFFEATLRIDLATRRIDDANSRLAF